jgi:flagellar biogenesis protein FliO
MSISCAILAPNYESGYFLMILSFIFVIALAFITTKWLSNTKFAGVKGKNMRVIERMFLASDKQLLIVEICKVYYLMSLDKTGIKMIDKLDNIPEIQQESNKTFAEVLDKFKINSKDK